MKHTQPLIGQANLQHLLEELRAYVDWTAEDSERLQAVVPQVKETFPQLTDDFYAEIERHPSLARVLASNGTEVAVLKGKLEEWLVDLFSNQDDDEFAARRWRIGWRHVEINLSQVYVSMAMSRLRTGLIRAVRAAIVDDVTLQQQTVVSLGKAIDLDLAIIQHAFETEQLRRKTEATRIRSEIRFQNLVEAATCMIVILREDNSIRYFSPFAEMLTGCAPADMQGRDYVTCCVPEEQREAARAYVASVAEGNKTLGIELPVCDKEGKRHWLAWNARRIDDMDERPVVLLVGHDITERKQAEQRLVQAERLAAIGQMITGLAHESRNALQRINASTEMLEFEVEDNPGALELVHRSQKALDDIHRLFDEVRNYAAPIHLERSMQPLPAVWREAWELLVHLRRDRDVTFDERSLDEQDPLAYVDRFRLVQVFRNLFENALSACEDPVQIRVTSCSQQLGDVPAWEVWLSDNGPGFSEEARREALHPFFTTKTKGTGLGLAIVQRLVHAHGGTVELMDRVVCTEPWQRELTGAIVKIVLPATPFGDDDDGLP